MTGIVGALETGCQLGEMLKIQNRHVLWDTHQIALPAEHTKDAEARRIPFEPKGRLSQLLKPRRFLGPNAFVFGTATGKYQGTIRTAWESLLAHGFEPTRTRAHGRVNREHLAEIDLHWHNLRHEAACRWLAKGLDLRAIQLLLGHADLKTPYCRPMRADPITIGLPLASQAGIIVDWRVKPSCVA